VDVEGDGKVRSPSVEIRRVGFYTYRERIAGSETITGVETECAIEAETSLGRPLILTGRGDEHVAEVVAAQDGADVPEPSRVRVASLGIDAPVQPMGIDMDAGAVGAPKDIRRVGWWRDGAAPSGSAGAILLAGHVDSAKRGAGAFYSLERATRGTRIELHSNDGRTRRYRVTSVKLVRKEALPPNVYSRTGARRLVLVTCGGPFDARRGHYRDNVVVTAVPLDR
jgi:LPXTG-site transpeptidase (sortase) family protein